MATWPRIVVAFALVLAACGGGDQDSATETAAATTGQTAASTVTTSAATTTTAQSTATDAAPPPTVAPSSSVPPAPEHVTFATSDGVTLEGTVFGTGGDAVVLGAMGLAEMETWFPFAEVLAAEGYTAFAYNMRGHGASEGEQMPFRVDVDAQAAIDFIRQRGAQRVFFFGASVNGVGAMAVGAENDLAGVVNISSPSDVDGVDAVALAPQVDEPKLFIVAEGDGPIPGMIQAVFDAAPEPKDIVVYSGDAHGTDLFGSHGDELTALLLDFVRSN